MFEIATTIIKWPVAFLANKEVAMFAYLWPIILVMAANVLYQIGAKEIPSEMDAFATLTITYAIATLTTLVMFLVSSGSGLSGLLVEYAKINWAVIMFGVSAVGLEVGFVFAYKNGWEVSLAYVVQSAVLSAMLLIVGYILYSEPITWNKVAGIAICVVGLVMLNRKRGEAS